MEINTEQFNGKLRVRVCGICLQNNNLLVVNHRGLYPGKDFWAPPGGGLTFGESIKNCLKREFAEETGLEIKPGRFLFLNEFLQPPFHAVELFFSVDVLSGTLKKGHDPELSPDGQLIAEVNFKNFNELDKIPLSEKHAILHELVDFDDLFIPQHRFV